MILKAFIGLCTALLFFGVPGAFPQDAQSTVPSKETKTVDKPVMLGGKILFHLATDAEGLAQANRAEESSKCIKKIADATTFAVDSIRTSDFNAPMTFILAGDEILTAVLDRDAVPKGKSRQQLADEYAQVIRTAIEKYRRERSLEQHIYGALLAGLYSELHQNILDVFNEYGVQIMSPNYKADRAEPAIVPKERWYAPPAKSPDEI